MSSTRSGHVRAASAADAAELLQGSEPGVLLVGPAAQTRHAIRLILDRLSDRSVMPVGFSASGATPAMLRQEVGQAHAARPSPDTDLLLVVAQAERLSPDLLHELEMAAEAAATHGGLKFLFAAPRDLSASLQRAELWSLAACVRTCLPVLPPPRPADPLPEQPAGHQAGALADVRTGSQTGDQVSGRPYPFDLLVEPLGVARHAQPTRSGPRIMLGVGILAVLSLALTGVLLEHQSVRPLLPPVREPVITLPSAPVPAAPAPAPPVAAQPAPPADPVTVPLPPTAVPETASPSQPSSSAPSSPLPAAPPASPAPAPPVAAVPPQEPADASPAVPTGSTLPPANPSPGRIDTGRIVAGQIVPQMAPARHASLLLMAGPDDTLSSLYAQVYRGTTPPPFAQVMTLNPVVRSGVRLVFPAPPTGWPAASPP